MNNFFLLVHAAVVLAVLGFFSAHAAAQPNIVLIMADDMGFSDTAPFGGEIHTPNLSQLASTGVRYTNFYNTARCSTTRASLLTGQYSHNVGMGALPSTNYNFHNGGTMPGYSGWFAGTDPQAPDFVPTLPEVMKSAGYDTSMSGKWHLTRTSTINSGPNGTWPTDKGFDQFYGTMEGAKNYFAPQWLVDSNTPQTFEDISNLPSDYFYTNAISEQGAQFIRNEYADVDSHPFFHYHSFYAPHFPLQAPNDAVDAQGNNLVAKYQAIYSQGWDSLRNDRLANQIAAGLFPSGTSLSSRASSDSGIPDWSSLTTTQRDEMVLRMSVYAAQVEILDQGVGKLMDAVRDPLGDGTGPGFDADNMMDETLFVFLSDNGAVGGDWNGTGSIGDWDNANSAINVRYGTGWGNLSNTPFRKFKTDTYEGGIASPLIVSGAGVDPSLAGSINDSDIAHVIDLAPTFMELGGASYPAAADASELEGLSLTRTFNGTGIDYSNREIFFEHEGNRGMVAGKWKLVAPNGSSNYELYDLSNDRDESNNVAAANLDVQRLLRLKWEAWAIRNKVANPNESNAGSPFLSNDEIDWLSQSAPAGLIAHYSFASDLASTDENAASAASDFQLGPKILHSTVSSTLRSEGNDPLNNTFAAAAANGFTAEFTIASAAGVDLDRMTFGARFNNMDAGESGTLILRSSEDGFTSDLLSVTNGNMEGTTDIPVDFDLSNFMDVTDLTFRFYFLGTNDASNERTRIVGPLSVFAFLGGDFDADGDYACDDVDALVAEIVAGTHGPSFDLTGDGFVDAADLGAWLAEAGAAELSSGNAYLYGDANLDGVVDASDFNAWNANKFTTTAAWCSGDFNADGSIDGSDFNVWNSNKFQSAGDVRSVPEPIFNIISLALLGCFFRFPRTATPRSTSLF